MIKKNIRTMTVILAIAAITAAFARAKDFQYDAHGKRDPFIPLISQEKITFMKLSDVTSIDDIKLEGIAVGAKGETMAIINGEMLKENSKVGEIEVKKITKRTVTILMDRKVYNLKLSEEGGIESE